MKKENNLKLNKINILINIYFLKKMVKKILLF